MSKSDIAWAKIQRWPARQSVNKPQWIDGQPIHGWDTETTNGRPFLITRALAGKRPHALHEFGDPIGAGKVWSYLTSRVARNGINCWFNLDFDANILLALLPETCLYRLLVTNETVWGQYHITYLPRKLLLIRDGAKHIYRHFDISQFFGTSLEQAAIAVLGSGKFSDRVDVKRFVDAAYIKAEWRWIVKYALRDAVLARDLFTVWSAEAEAVGVPCGRPYSTGYLAEQAYNYTFSESGKPGFAGDNIQHAYWQAYHGGRFEVIKRGAVGDVTIVDINSAYPAAQSKLPDPGSLTWILLHDGPLFEHLYFGDHQVVCATVSTDLTKPIQPFGVKHKGRLIFPVLKNFKAWFFGPLFRYAVEQGLVTDYTIHRMYLGINNPVTRYPYTFIHALYEEKKRYDSQGRTKKNIKREVLKLLLNSMYGKTAQLTDKTGLLKDGVLPKRSDFHVPVEVYPTSIQSWLFEMGFGVKKTVRSGRYFNPFLACHMTGETRLALLRGIYDHGLENAVIMLATDSLMIERDAFNASNFQFSDSLGGWSLENEGNAFIVGSGIYELVDSEGVIISTKTRGFRPGYGVWAIDVTGGLRNTVAAISSETSLEISPRRPLKIPQALYQRYDLSQVGQFLEFPRDIRAGMDQKRVWTADSPTWGELLAGPEVSKPLAHGTLNA